MVNKSHILTIILIFLLTPGCGIFITRPRLRYTNGSFCILDEDTFKYSDNSLNYINKRITADTDVIILCIHGLGAHAGCFNSLQDYLYEMNISSISFDLRGFGHCSGKKGDIGNIGAHIDDINQIIRCIKSEYNPTKIILLGASLGSSLAIWYAYTYPNEIDGLILTSLVTTHKKPKNSFRSVLRLIIGFAFSPGKPIALELEYQLYSDNKELIEWTFNIDTLRTRKISARYLIQSNYVIKNSHKQLCDIDKPTLLLQGGKDLLSAKKDIENILSACNDYQIYFEYYADNYHSIFYDNNCLDIFSRINEWLNEEILK
jgi:alpha-beta hydrolase superfamily lysophospholipase